MMITNVINAPKKECKLVLNFDNLKHSFDYGYSFYMTSLFEIWCDKGIKKWKNYKIL